MMRAPAHCTRRCAGAMAVLCAVALCAPLSVPVAVSADPLTDSLALVPDAVEVAKDSSFDVVLELDSATETRGAQFTIAFDASLLRCDNVVLGDYYDPWGAAHGATVLQVGYPPTIDNTSGTTSNTGIMLIGGDSGGPTGIGTVAVLSFTAIGEGSCTVALADYGVADTAVPPNQVDMAVTNASIAVRHAGWVPENPLPELNAVWGTGGIAFAGGYNGALLAYDGAWTTASSGTASTLNDIWGPDAGTAYAAGSDGAIISYDGNAWSPMTSPVSSDLYGIWGNTATDVFAVGDGGTILFNDGTGWTVMTSPVTTPLYGVGGLGAADAYAVGAGGTILHFDGANWNMMPGGTTSDLHDVWIGNDGIGWAAGDNGTMLKLVDGTWSPVQTGTTQCLRGVSGGHSSDVFAVGDSGTILHFAGIRWRPMEGGGTYDLYDVHGSSSTNAFIVGHGSVILHRSPLPIAPDWDLNGDGVCDLYDVLLVADHWNESGLPGWIAADIDMNGVIDLYDVLLLADHWNETW